MMAARERRESEIKDLFLRSIFLVYCLLHLLFKIATNFLSALYWSWRCTKKPRQSSSSLSSTILMMKEAPLLSAGNLNLLFAIVHWLTVTATQTSGKIRGKIESFLQSRRKRQQVSYCADSTRTPPKRAFHLLKRLVWKCILRILSNLASHYILTTFLLNSFFSGPTKIQRSSATLK